LFLVAGKDPTLTTGSFIADSGDSEMRFVNIFWQVSEVHCSV